MNKEFIPYDLALELKELGFDEKCMAIYFTPTKELLVGKEVNEFTTEVRIYAPLYQQAFRWFREKYEIFVSIESSYHVEGDPERYYEHTRTVLCFRGHFKSLTNQISSTSFYDTYEEAENACLVKLIEIAKQLIVNTSQRISDEVDKLVVEEMINIAKSKYKIAKNK